MNSIIEVFIQVNVKKSSLRHLKFVEIEIEIFHQNKGKIYEQTCKQV